MTAFPSDGNYRASIARRQEFLVEAAIERRAADAPAEMHSLKLKGYRHAR
jgi:hypothetical protein